MGDHTLWQAAADGPHSEEPARMNYHGIYSSMHLRALKHLAELSYWRWKYQGQSSADAKLSAVVNRKFVHIISHVMPQRGWTCEVEYERVLELEKSALDTSEFSNGLREKTSASNADAKAKAATTQGKSKSKKSSAGAADSTAKSDSAAAS